MYYSTNVRGIDVVVEYDFEVTYRGCRATPASLDYPGDPGEATEYDLTILEITWDGGDKREAHFTKKYRDRIMSEIDTSDELAQAIEDYYSDDYNEFNREYEHD